ncbi:helix-turn-helix domain-containing protein [Massilia niabensis]|uniref:Helix-turn-helix domain-containing protein n=1 Tax=Massilia niabensis TaxID=544910 RepID=A0ABW0LAG1_9BURK
MTSERAEQGATPDNHQRQPGATLAAQRESMGWTVEQVAEQLKLAVRQVVAIEKGNYAALPSPAVTRGFVRAYAKILRLDPAPLVAMVPMDNPVPEDTGVPVRRDRQTSFSHSRYPTHGKRSNLPLAWIAGVAVVATAGAAVWHFGLVSLPGSDASSSGAAAGNGEAVLSTPAEAPGANGPMPDTVLNPSVPLISVPGPADTSGNAGPAATGTPAAPAGAGAAPAAVPPAAVPPAALATPPAATPAAAAPLAAASAAAAPAVGGNTLVLNVREDSWIEVRPQGGKALVSRLVKGGSTETVEVPNGATLTVGNPGGVSATLRGAAVALPPVPGKTISRVTLK